MGCELRASGRGRSKGRRAAGRAPLAGGAGGGGRGAPPSWLLINRWKGAVAARVVITEAGIVWSKLAGPGAVPAGVYLKREVQGQFADHRTLTAIRCKHSHHGFPMPVTPRAHMLVQPLRCGAVSNSSWCLLETPDTLHLRVRESITMLPCGDPGLCKRESPLTCERPHRYPKDLVCDVQK